MQTQLQERERLLWVCSTSWPASWARDVHHAVGLFLSYVVVNADALPGSVLMWWAIEFRCDGQIDINRERDPWYNTG